ncbi:MAG: hypothetical protein KH111_19480, partial [Bacteroidales bacterium]|nr:hypothetical protein [Bacteroidales bacterium]
MEVCNVDEIIARLESYKSFKGLKFSPIDFVREIVNGAVKDVPYSPEIPQSIKSLEKYVINAKKNRLSKVELAKALNVSRS